MFKSPTSNYHLTISPWDLIGRTLSDIEREKIGLSDDILVLILKQISSLKEGSLSLGEVKETEFKTKFPSSFRIKKEHFVRVVREFPYVALLKKLEFFKKDYIGKKDLVDLGVSKKDFRKFANSVFVLSKINFKRIDFLNLYLHRTIMNINNSRLFQLSFQPASNQNYDHDERSYKCPFQEKRCSIYFERIRRLGYERYSCSNCIVLAGEKRIKEREGCVSYCFFNTSSLHNEFI